VQLSLQWSWSHELLASVLNAFMAVFLFAGLDRLKQRT
jgi:hypothetical protein